MVTEKEKAAIVARLRDLPGVETIYFQDPGHFLKLAKLSDPKSKLDETYPGSFYVKFSDPALARAIRPRHRADARRSGGGAGPVEGMTDRSVESFAELFLELFL